MGASSPTPPGQRNRAQIMADALVQSISMQPEVLPGRDQRYEVNRPLFRTEEYERARQGAHTADIEATVLRFAQMVQISGQLSRTRLTRYPRPEPFGSNSLLAWFDEDGHPIPIDLTDSILQALTIGGGISGPIEYLMHFDALHRDVSEVEHPSRGRVEAVGMSTAIESLRIGLTEFLAVRLVVEGNVDPETGGGLSKGPNSPGQTSRSASITGRGKRQRAVEEQEKSSKKAKKVLARSLGAAAATASGLPDSPYLPFTVHTRTPDLDIEQAPAYFLTWTFFGGPSTPRDGYILPGLYRFRGQDSKGNYRYDSKKFKIPPLQYASTIL